MALTEPNILVFTAGKTQERIDLGFHFLGPVTTRKHVLYKKAGRAITITGLEDLKRQQLKVGVMRGHWQEKFFMDQGVTVEAVTTHPQNIKKVLRDRIDLFTSSDLELGETLKIAEVNADQIEEVYVYREISGYLLFSKDTSPEILAQWQQAFSALQSTDFFEKTAKKWSGILGISLHYSAEKGFFVQQK